MQKWVLKTFVFLLNTSAMVLTAVGFLAGFQWQGLFGAIIGVVAALVVSAISLGLAYALVQTAENSERLVALTQETNRLLASLRTESESHAPRMDLERV